MEATFIKNGFVLLKLCLIYVILFFFCCCAALQGPTKQHDTTQLKVSHANSKWKAIDFILRTNSVQSRSKSMCIDGRVPLLLFSDDIAFLMIVVCCSSCKLKIGHTWSENWSKSYTYVSSTEGEKVFNESNWEQVSYLHEYEAKFTRVMLHTIYTTDVPYNAYAYSKCFELVRCLEINIWPYTVYKNLFLLWAIREVVGICLTRALHSILVSLDIKDRGHEDAHSEGHWPDFSGGDITAELKDRGRIPSDSRTCGNNSLESVSYISTAHALQILQFSLLCFYGIFPFSRPNRGSEDRWCQVCVFCYQT